MYNIFKCRQIFPSELFTTVRQHATVYGIQQEYVINYQLVNVKKTILYSHRHCPR